MTDSEELTVKNTGQIFFRYLHEDLKSLPKVQSLHKAKTTIFKCSIAVILTCHILVYMIAPSTESNMPVARETSRLVQSFDNFFFEKILKIKDHTPHTTDDDIHRMLPILQVENVAFRKLTPEPTIFPLANLLFPPLIQFRPAGVADDILVPPPQNINVF